MLRNGHYGGGKRAAWIFIYTAAQVANGARQQKAYREKRLKIWKAKRDEVMQEIRSKGLTVSDSAMEDLVQSMAASYQISNAKSYNRNSGPTIQVDERLKEKLGECYTKVEEHERLAHEYDLWIQTLSAQPEVQLELDVEDFKFFFFNVDPNTKVAGSPIPTPARRTSAPAPAPASASASASANLSPTIVTPAQAPVLKPSAPLLQPTGGQISPIPAFVTPPPAETSSAPATPSVDGVKTIFVPPDFEDEVPSTQSESSPLDDWPED